MRGTGFRGLSWQVHCTESYVSGKDEDGLNVTGSFSYDVTERFTAGDAWSNVRAVVKLKRNPEIKTEKPLSCGLGIFLRGHGYLYLDDVTLTEGNNPF